MISVIIPAYNRAEMLKRSVESVIAQTFSNFELIVVNDGSKEDLSEVESIVKNTDYHFINKENKGVAAARNTGVSHAKGKWVSFLDSDDLWLERKLESQLEFLKVNPSYRILQCEEIWIRNDSFVNPKLRHQMPNGEAFFKSLELCCISPSAVILERELFNEIGGFDERFSVCEDYELWLRISAKYPVGLLKEPLVKKYGGHQDQLSRSEPAIDRFRVCALVKLLLNTELSEAQTRATLVELGRKTDILLKGALKRDNKSAISLYSCLREKASEYQGTEKFDYNDLQASFSSLFEPLIQQIK